MTDRPTTPDPAPAAAPHKLGFGQKLAWGIGGFPENLANSAILSLVYPIFNVAMGFSTVAIGLALSASRITDALNDPLVGNWTDNTRTRWGRRRPWMFAGAILMALFFALLWQLPAWLPPLGGAAPEAALASPLLAKIGLHTRPDLWMFGALFAVGVLFYFSFTMFVIPYSGLGIELAEDYTDRTSLQTYRLVPSFVASLLVGWLYFWSQKAGGWLGGNEVAGVRLVGALVAVAILLTALVPALFCRERFAGERPQEPIRLFAAVRLTMTHRPFLMLMGSVFAVFVGLFFTFPLMTYIGIYHCCDGDKLLAAKIGGVLTIVQTVGQFLAMPLIAWLNRFLDKKAILFGGLGLAIAGYVSSWWLFTPAHPWWQIIPVVISAWGLCSCWVVNGSFAADICDDDELRSGRRREGLYSAVFAFVYKTAIGLVAIASGALLAGVGVKGQETSLPVEALTRVRLAYLAIPAVFLTLAIASMACYPLTRRRVQEIQRELRARRGGA